MNTPNNRRRRESQQKMEAAFSQLLQEQELNRISVTDICRIADVNRSTFYANYEDVYALAQAFQKHLEEDIMELYREEWEQRRSQHNFLKLFYHIRDNQLLYRTYFKLNPGNQLQVFGYDIQEAAAYYNNKYIEYHIEFFGNGLNAVIRRWLKNDCRETPEEIFSVIVSEYMKMSV